MDKKATDEHIELLKSLAEDSHLFDDMIINILNRLRNIRGQ